MIRGIHHPQITVPKGAEPEARRFYCDLLGLREIEKPETLRARGGFWLEVGAQQLHVGTEDGVDRQATRAHVAYQVDDLRATRAALEAAGVPTKTGEDVPGMIRCEFRDPFGNRVEIVELLSR